MSDLDAALDAYAAQPTEEVRLAVLVAAGSYEQLLRRHIAKENDVVFPFGERSLSPEASQRVEEQMRGFDTNEANAAEREHQLGVLAVLEKKYMA